MTREEMPIMKRPIHATRPFPWRCHGCGKDAVEMAAMAYAAEMRHDGRLHSFTIPVLHLPICGECGEKVFTEEVDRQMNDALRAHLGVFTPDKIRAALRRVG